MLAGTAQAAPEHGIAMHGAPKYPANFTHLDYVRADAPKGGELRRALTGSFDSLNHYVIKGNPGAGRELVHETLLKRAWDEPFTMYGLVADTVETPNDRSWVAFTIRPEARFHDGSPLTVDDVIFSFETLRDKGRPNHRLYYRKVTRVERVGSRGVRFTFQPGSDDRELPLIMGLMPILSRSYYATHTFDESTLTPPLGSGPYRVASVDPGRSIVYERVPDYWGRDLAINRGQNNFERIRFDYFRDSNVAFEAFKAGQTDVRQETNPTTWATGYDFPAAKDGKVVLEKLPQGRPEGMSGYVLNLRRELFADPRVREALGLAFDFEWINANLLYGAYARTTSFFANSELAATGEPTAAERKLLDPLKAQLAPAVFGPAAMPPTTDGSGNNRANLGRADQLLKDAGWTIRNGKRRRADGTELAFEVLLLSAQDEKVALTWARSLERLGVTARVRTVDSSQFELRRRTFDYEVLAHNWGVTLSPGNEQAHYWGSAAAAEEGTRNYIGLKDPAVDQLITQIVAARTRDDLVAATRALDRVLRAGHYVVPHYYLPEDRVALWNRLAHPDVMPTYGYVIETWWQDPAKAATNPR